jgi:hypothetical protein
MPCVTGVAQAGMGLGAFSTSTKHMRDEGTGLLGRLNHHAARSNLNLFTVNLNFYHGVQPA